MRSTVDFKVSEHFRVGFKTSFDPVPNYHSPSLQVQWAARIGNYYVLKTDSQATVVKVPVSLTRDVSSPMGGGERTPWNTPKPSC